MNYELVKNLDFYKKYLKEIRKGYVEEYNKATTSEDKKRIVSLVKANDEKFVEVRDTLKQYLKLSSDYCNAIENKESNEVIDSLSIKLSEVEEHAFKLIAEYNKATDKDNKKVVNVTEEKTSTATRVIGGMLAIAASAAVGTIVGEKLYDKYSNDCEYETEQEKEEEKEEVPFETYGKFTDINNERQLRNRANWYYENYVSRTNGVNAVSVEQIMNDMRIINGEFALDNSGNPTYNDMDIINTANNLHTIANYDSFAQYGTQIYFTPMAPLFEDGSLAQKGAIALDNAMEKVVSAIRANNNEEFLTAAREWGIIVNNMFNYIDFTGEYVNIYQVEAPTSFQLYHAMSAKYASTILEYSLSNQLNVCIPYCTDYNTGEMKEIALSELMYNLNEVPMDAVAVRSGHQAEYEENNLSLPENLFLAAKNYYNSKYELEIGKSRILK